MEKEDVLRKVREMLARADHPKTPPAEAQAAREMAERLITKFTIEQFELDEAERKAGRKAFQPPEMRQFDYGSIGVREADEAIALMFGRLATHCHVRIGEYGWHVSKAVGYPTDLDYLDMLFTSIRLHMSSHLTPTWDPDLTMAENVHRMKEAGYKWERIYKLEPGGPGLYKKRVENGIEFFETDSNGKRKHNNHLFNAYKAYCKENGIRHVGINPDMHIRSFVRGYTVEVNDRLYKMQRVRDEASAGKGLVLASRKSQLDEFLYELFPHLRPHEKDCTCARCRPNYRAVATRGRSYQEKKIDAASFNSGVKAGSEVDLMGGRNTLPGRRGIEG